MARRKPPKPKPPRQPIKGSKYALAGLNKGLYDKLDSADQKAYKQSLYSGYIQKFKELKEEHRGDRIKEQPNRPRQPYRPKDMVPPGSKSSSKYNPDPNGFIGSGLTGLGPNELKRRIEQHNALADKAFQSAGGGKKEALTSADVANVYRGIQLKNRAKAMQALNDPKIHRNKK